MLIYIHGFNSSPRSFKARLVSGRLAELGLAGHFCCPALSPVPGVAMEQLDAAVRSCDEPPALIGSSLGGYYATLLAERHGLRAALLNPAVRPYALLQDYTGRQRNLHTGAEYDFTAAHVAQLRVMEVDAVDAARYLLIVGTADEVLDHRQALERYRGCRQIVVVGGDHGLSGFADHVDETLRFCGVDLPGRDPARI